MAQDTSIQRRSFVANCELVSADQAFEISQAAPDFVVLRRPVTVPLGPAELIIRYDDQPDPVRRQIIVTGPSANDPLHINIQRTSGD